MALWGPTGLGAIQGHAVAGALRRDDDVELDAGAGNARDRPRDLKRHKLFNIHTRVRSYGKGEPLWLSGKVVKNEKINEIKRTRVRSPPRATSLIKNVFMKTTTLYIKHLFMLDDQTAQNCGASPC
jgi:hypothetical protein